MQKRKQSALILTVTSLLLLLSAMATFPNILAQKTFFASATTTDFDPDWSLTFDGDISNSFTASINELIAMPKSEVYGEIYCDRLLVTKGTFGGVSLSYLIEKAILLPGASNLAFQADDGYVINVAVEAAPGFVLAYEMDNEPLPEVLRLAVPGYPGNLWIHHITRITASTSTDYHIGSNYYSSPHDQYLNIPTPRLISTPKPFPTPPPAKPTATPDPSQIPSPSPNVPSIFPTSPITNTPIGSESPTASVPYLGNQQESSLTSFLTGGLVSTILAVVVILIVFSAMSLLILKIRTKTKAE